MSALASYADTSRAYWLRYTASREPKIEDKAAWGGLMTPITTVMLPIESSIRYFQALKFPDAIVVRHKILTKPFTKSSQILEMEAIVVSRRQGVEVARIHERLSFVNYSDGKRQQVNAAQFKPALVSLYDTQIQHEQETEEILDAFHERLDRLEEHVPESIEDMIEGLAEESAATNARSEYVARIRKARMERENLRKEMASDYTGEGEEEENQDDDEDGMLNDLRREMEAYENANQSK
ncbi:major facilitator superfamily transporter transporter [Fusarium heterosporum]|uniref:Major facilitator superfamily transporter transporter n=1 Tax=Fusarium heterosporum TaxID=42747 RepID=A0A8H5WR10_FUSHE|nr:major facilitator superfamily transporter transporter [Fusarium heterosporum]